METNQKSSRATVTLLVVTALSMLLSGLFVATASRSDASPTPACAEGFSLTADEKNCFQAAVVTSADNPNSCADGALTPTAPRASLMPRSCLKKARPCARAATRQMTRSMAIALDLNWPHNGPLLVPMDRMASRELLHSGGQRPIWRSNLRRRHVGRNQLRDHRRRPNQWRIVLPRIGTILQDGTECYTLVAPTVTAGSCDSAYFGFGSVCKINNTGTDQDSVVAFTCPAPSTGESVIENTHTTDGITKIESCEYSPNATAGDCPANTTLDDNGVDCRRPVDLRPGALACADGFGLVDGKCIRYETPANASAQCPSGSVEDNDGSCRKPVADSAGAYFCPDETAALNARRVSLPLASSLNLPQPCTSVSRATAR